MPLCLKQLSLAEGQHEPVPAKGTPPAGPVAGMFPGPGIVLGVGASCTPWGVSWDLLCEEPGTPVPFLICKMDSSTSHRCWVHIRSQDKHWRWECLWRLRHAASSLGHSHHHLTDLRCWSRGSEADPWPVGDPYLLPKDSWFPPREP